MSSAEIGAERPHTDGNAYTQFAGLNNLPPSTANLPFGGNVQHTARTRSAAVLIVDGIQHWPCDSTK